MDHITHLSFLRLLPATDAERTCSVILYSSSWIMLFQKANSKQPLNPRKIQICEGTYKRGWVCLKSVGFISNWIDPLCLDFIKFGGSPHVIPCYKCYNGETLQSDRANQNLSLKSSLKINLLTSQSKNYLLCFPMKTKILAWSFVL